MNRIDKKETMRLEKEEREEQWERKQKQYEFEINQLEEMAKMESTEMEKLRKDNEQLKGLREEETNRHAETTEIKCTETREIEGELDGVKDEHTHIEVERDNGDELAERVGTRCKQLDSLLQERGEGVSPLEADRDQVGPVELCEVEGTSAVDKCTRSLGGMEAPGTLVVTRSPGVDVLVCVFTSVVKCVLQRAHSVGTRVCVRAATCVKETPRVTETPSVKETPCVSGVVVSVPKCVLPSTPCVEEAPRVNETPCVEEMTCVSENPCANGRPCVSGTTCARKMACVRERPCVRETACVRSLCVREMTVGMWEHAAASVSVSVMTWCVSGVTRRCAWLRVCRNACFPACRAWMKPRVRKKPHVCVKHPVQVEGRV